MGSNDIDRNVTDALLLDAIDGLEVIVSGLTVVYEELCAQRRSLASTRIVWDLFHHLGFWEGRLEGGLSVETEEALARFRASDVP